MDLGLLMVMCPVLKSCSRRKNAFKHTARRQALAVDCTAQVEAVQSCLGAAQLLCYDEV